MTLEEIKNLLEATGMPVVYRAWPTGDAPPLPYLCYLVAYSNNFAADDRVYYPVNHIQVELYTKHKDLGAEAKTEDALSCCCWEKSETYLDDEQCYQIIYEIEV